MIKRTDVVYLVGPMTGLPNYNHAAFFAAKRIIELCFGCRVLNPARQPLGLEYNEYARRGIEDVHAASVLVVLPGWQKSGWAPEEMATAIIHNKPVLHLDQIFKRKVSPK